MDRPSVFRFTDENGGCDGLSKVTATFDTGLSYGGKVASYDRTAEIQRLLRVTSFLLISRRSDLQTNTSVERNLDTSAPESRTTSTTKEAT